MTVKRQYSLPNCKLLLEGLSDAAGQFDARPLLSILVSAECHFVGHEIPLTGGRDFFEALVQAVSSYAQELLSGVQQSEVRSRQTSLVQLQRLDGGYLHRLSVRSAKPAAEKANRDAPAQPQMQVDLTTVQLFDLVEAVDQFFADTQTLPDLSLQLTPAPKRYATAREPIAKRAVPLALGTTGLALAAVAFFVIPVPEARAPKEILRKPETTSSPTATGSPTTSPEASDSPKPENSPEAASIDDTEPDSEDGNEPDNEPDTATDVTPPSAEDLEAALSSTPAITEPDQLFALERYLYGQLNQAWKERTSLGEKLAYKVLVVPDGSIVGYKGEDQAARDRADRTPLRELLYFQPGENAIPQEPMAQFKVVFTKGGVLQISPWHGYVDSPGPAPRIANSDQLKTIGKTLQEQIQSNWKGKLSFTENLVFKVEANQDGTIVDYDANNQPARDYRRETPLDGLIDLSGAVAKTESGKVERAPIGEFRVVFTPGGTVLVNSW